MKRSRSPFGPWMGAFLLGLLLLAAVPRSVAAQAEDECFEWLGDVTIESGRELACDLFVMGGSLYLEQGATVGGSVNVPLGSARLSGVVMGDVAVGRDLEIGGQVMGDAAALGGDATVSGSVLGDLAALRGQVTVAGRVDGSIAAGGDVTVSGIVGGGVTTDGDLVLERGANVQGDVRATGEIDRSEGAVVHGVADASGTSGRRWLDALKWILAMVGFAVVFGALAVQVIPEALDNVRDAASGSGAMTLFLGLLSLVLLPFLALLVLPVFLYLGALAVGVVGVGELIGRRLWPAAGRSGRAGLGAGFLAVLIGSLLMIAFSSLVGFCGALLPLALLLAWPLGAGLLTLLGRRRWGAAQPEASGPSEGGAREAPVPSGAWPGEARPAIEELPATPIPASPPPARQPAEPSHTPDGEPSQPMASAPAQPDPIAVLRQVAGITPIYAGLLAEAGIADLPALAQASPARIVELVAAQGVLPIDLELAERWVMGARAMVAGG
ncbi:MAG: polymer-forming cytoskeletal protein [Caldilineae bacterium]|nr:polymer-forming cytoskeletal protein [Caldilineae bacterium]